MNKALLAILVCPLCKGRLVLKKQELIYDTKSLEDMIFFIDRMKIKKRFKRPGGDL